MISENDFSPAEFEKLFEKSKLLWVEFLRKKNPAEKDFEKISKNEIEKIAHNAAIFSGNFRAPENLSDREISETLKVAKFRPKVSPKFIHNFLEKEKMSAKSFSVARAEKMFFEFRAAENLFSENENAKNVAAAAGLLAAAGKNSAPKKFKIPEKSRAKVPNFLTKNPPKKSENSKNSERNFAAESQKVAPQIQNQIASEARKIAEKQKVGGAKRFSGGGFFQNKKQNLAAKWGIGGGLLATAFGSGIFSDEAAAAGLDFLSNL